MKEKEGYNSLVLMKLTMRALMSTALFSLLAACGGGATEPEGQSDAGVDPDGGIERALCQSSPGTRLTREVLESHGARQELGIIDSEFDSACQYQLEADGSFTCYPGDVGGALFFQDAECTSAIVGFGVGAQPALFQQTIRNSEEGCLVARDFRRVGAASAVTAGQSVFDLDAAGACVAQLAPDRDYYLAGPVLGRDAFVTAETQLVADAARLSSQRLLGSDGSSMCSSARRAVDATLGAACDLRPAADQTTRCLPTVPAVSSFFSDAACSAPVNAALVSSCLAEPPAYAFTNETLACGAVVRHVHATDASMSITRFDLNVDQCVAADPANSYIAVTEEVAASAFAAVAPELAGSASSRLQRELLVTDDGFATFLGHWFDNTLQQACTFQPAADNSLRCLPGAMTLRNFFSDAQCAAPISLALIDECQVATGFFAAPSPMGTRMLAAVPHEAPVFSLDSGICQPVAGTFFAAAFELAPSSFELAEVQRLATGP